MMLSLVLSVMWVYEFLSFQSHCSIIDMHSNHAIVEEIIRSCRRPQNTAWRRHGWYETYQYVGLASHGGHP